MGVEFRLGRQDHRKVEDFLSRQPAGVSAIVLDTKAARHQRGAAEAAHAAEVDVLFDPATERLTEPGFELEQLPYCPNTPYDLNVLAGNAADRATLVTRVVYAHPETVTIVTPPHFYVYDDRSAHLNVALAEATIHETDKPVRATLVLSRRYGVTSAQQLAADYWQAGIRHIELRISPLGGEDEGIAKLRSAFQVTAAFTDIGLDVVLGLSGNIGQTAVALGHARDFSIGIGMREKVDHSEMISRQKKPPKPEAKRGGPAAGIYLPGLAITLSRKAGAALLEHTDIRARIGCRLGVCSTSIAGPSADPRAHYLHARAHEMNQMESRPAPWRPMAEVDRLRRALELRELINRSYLSATVHELSTRTLRSLIDSIEGEQAARTA